MSDDITKEKLNAATAKELISGLALCACVAGAVYLAANGHDGWGWLIFLAICIL